jgi:hypothetical protein
MTLQTMTHRREDAQRVARKGPALSLKRSARRVCAEPRARNTANSGDRR